MLAEKERMHVGRDTTFGDCSGAEELVELFIVAESDLDVAWGNGGLLLFFCGIACELSDLTDDVLNGGCHEYTSAFAHPVGEAALLDQPVEASNREDEVDPGTCGHMRLASSSLVCFLKLGVDRSFGWHYEGGSFFDFGLLLLIKNQHSLKYYPNNLIMISHYQI